MSPGILRRLRVELRAHERKWNQTKRDTDKLTFLHKKRAFEDLLSRNKSKFFNDKITELGNDQSK